MDGTGIYPLPVYVNGFACLNTSEIELAKNDVNPAHPQSDPAGPVRAATEPATENVRYDPSKVTAAREEAQVRSTQVIAYSPDAVTTAKAPTGAVMQLQA